MNHLLDHRRKAAGDPGNWSESVLPHPQRAETTLPVPQIDAGGAGGPATASDLTSCLLNQALHGIVVVDRSMAVQFINDYALHVLDRRTDIHMRNGHLSPARKSVQDAMALAVRMAAEGKKSRAAPGRPLSSFRFNHEGNEMIISVDLLPDPVARALSVERGALLRLVDMTHSPASPRQILTDAYGLTPTEARIAEALAEGLSPQDFAHREGMSLNTARWYVKQVQAKTDCRRQADIVRLVVAMRALGAHPA